MLLVLSQKSLSCTLKTCHLFFCWNWDSLSRRVAFWVCSLEWIYIVFSYLALKLFLVGFCCLFFLRSLKQQPLRLSKSDHGKEKGEVVGSDLENKRNDLRLSGSGGPRWRHAEWLHSHSTENMLEEGHIWEMWSCPLKHTDIQVGFFSKPSLSLFGQHQDM